MIRRLRACPDPTCHAYPSCLNPTSSTLACAPFQSDTDVFFDLKKLLEESKAPVPPELARHDAAKQKPGAVDGKPKRDAVQYAKK